MSATGPADAPSKFMEIPLELRFKIFEIAADRPMGPDFVFAHWFEKKEIKEAIAAHVAANPSGLTPIPAYTNFQPEPDSELDDDDDEESEDEDDADDEENEDEDEDEDDDTELGVEEQDAPEDHDGEDNENVEAALQEEDAIIDEGEGQEGQVEEGVESEDVFPNGDEVHEGEMEAENGTEDAIPSGGTAAYEDNTENPEANQQVETSGEVGPRDENEVHAAVDSDGSMATQPVPPPRPHTIQASPKWRHIPKFMKITHCPPPIELLLASKELNKQAMDWYYEAAVLRIQATSGSMAHTTFFELAFEQITDAAFSPVENIRKVEVIFVWDTVWLRASENHELLEAILPVLLQQRAIFIANILKRAPMLRELMIHWHDSIQDDNSACLKIEILENFYDLPCNIEVKEYYLKPDEKPYRKSIAGKFRLELQEIADRGLHAFYG